MFFFSIPWFVSLALKFDQPRTYHIFGRFPNPVVSLDSAIDSEKVEQPREKIQVVAILEKGQSDNLL